MNIQISVVVPVFRSQSTLRMLYQRIVAVFGQLQKTFELVFVEDDGGDASWDTIVDLAREDSRVYGIRLARNFGQHNALLCGIHAARGETIVTLDDDMQNPPEEIPHLLQKLDQGFDVVYGAPVHQQHGLLRNIASRITKIALQQTMGATTAGKVSAFRAFRTSLRESFSGYRGPNVNIDVLLTWGTTRFSSVTVEHSQRARGESGYTLRKLITHGVNMITGFSTLPLQMASVLGLFFSVFGMILLVYVLGRYVLEGSSVPGFPFLASMIALFSGVQLFALGVIGEYLARMHFRTMDRPAFLKRESTECR